MRYRPEIDGLRAIAVMAVVVYHAQFQIFGTTLLTGGYVGVDVFFVISGYLISTLIFEEFRATGRFDILHFYERRARRILPALFLVILISLPFAWVLLLPTALSEFAHSLAASLLFYANFFFYFSTTEYAAEWSLLKPFLHMWSLAVEEQFYVFFPLLALLLHRMRRGRIVALFALAGFSFVFALYMHGRDPDLNFYLLPSRIWELTAGVLLAAFMLERERSYDRRLHLVLPLLGVLAILVASFAFDENTPHPSYPTLLPVLGSVLIVLFARPSIGVGKVLASRAFVATGLISYSLYLFHFPVFAFLRLGVEAPSNLVFLIATLVCMVLAWGSYRFVEQPFRNKTRIGAKGIFRVAAYGVVTTVLAASMVVNRHGNFGQFDYVRDALVNFEFDNRALDTERGEFMADTFMSTPFRPNTTRVLMVGNSHAKDLTNAFLRNAELFPALSFRMFTIQMSCFSEDRPEPKEFFASVDYAQADVVFIAPQYALGRGCRSEENPDQSDFVGMDVLLKRAQKDGKVIVLASNTVEFRDIAGQTIIDHHVRRFLADDARDIPRLLADVNAAYYAERNTHRPEISALNGEVKGLAEAYGALYLDKQRFVCDEPRALCFGFTDDGHKVFWDYGHFTNEGAAFLGRRIAQIGWLDPLYERLGLD